MSYARWSNSSWYAFDNVNGKLSLWYSMDQTFDWEYDELVEVMAQDPEKIPLFLSEVYSCTIDEAKEAIGYIAKYIEGYDPSVGKEYDEEVKAMLEKWRNDDVE